MQDLFEYWGGDFRESQCFLWMYKKNKKNVLCLCRTFSSIGVEISGKVTVFSFDSEYAPGPVNIA
jgi:hypothetical protein